MQVKLFTENETSYGEILQIDGSIVPPVGAILDLSKVPALIDDDGTEFMVISVVYRATTDGFVPLITAKQWYEGYRFEILEDYGWLKKENVDTLGYDEDTLFHFDSSCIE